MKKGLKTLLLYVVMIAVVMIAVFYVTGSFKPKEITYSEVYDYFKNEQVHSFEISNTNELTMLLYPTTENGINYDADEKELITVSFKLRSLSLFHETIYEKFVPDQHERAVIVEYHYQPEQSLPIWVSFLPYIILIVLMILL